MFKDVPVKIVNLKIVDDNEDVVGLVGESRVGRGRERGFAGTALTSGGPVLDKQEDSKTDREKMDQDDDADEKHDNTDAAID